MKLIVRRVLIGLVWAVDGEGESFPADRGTDSS
jgi:hypothetical protein